MTRSAPVNLQLGVAYTGGRASSSIFTLEAPGEQTSMHEPTATRADLGPHLLTASGSFATVWPLATVLATVIVALLVAAWVRDGTYESAAASAPVAFVIWLSGVLLFRGLVQFFRVRVYANGIEGRSKWWIPRRFRWSDIAGYRYDGAGGMRFVVLLETETGRELWMLREIEEREDFRTAVERHFDWPEMVRLGARE